MSIQNSEFWKKHAEMDASRLKVIALSGTPRERGRIHEDEPRKNILGVIVFVASFFLSAQSAWPHYFDLRALQPLDWHNPQVSRVTASGFEAEAPTAKTIHQGERHCTTANALAIDVADDFAFDIDETVEVEVEFDLQRSDRIVGLWYDRNAPEAVSVQTIGNGVGRKVIQLPGESSSRWHREVFILERSRLAGLAHGKSDLILFAVPMPAETGESRQKQILTICDISFKRSYSTPQPVSFGRLNLVVEDKYGSKTPARIGLYDETGRMPLPTSEAVDIKWDRELRKVTELTPGYGGPWPVSNVRVFYIDGEYHARLPTGVYHLVVSRGMEYEIVERRVTIEAGRNTTISVQLPRWADMPAKGWYSGDTHLHMGREHSKDDHSIALHTRAEGLNVSNILQMGDIGTTFFNQYNWMPEAQFGDGMHFIVPGQEDPRTSLLGHTLQLNIKAPVRNQERYFLYHDVFENVQNQGGVTAYAHLHNLQGYNPITDPLGGLALDVPFNLVDLVEILYGSGVDIQTWLHPAWFDFLNLGFKLAPTAGTDYMDYAIQPGAVRTYVYLGETYDSQAMPVQEWFDGLKSGRSFVTSGPMLSMSMNKQQIGADVTVSPGDELQIHAQAAISSQIDLLGKMVLYEQGKKVAEVVSPNGEESLILDYVARASHGTWFVLLAFGKNHHGNGTAIAASAPTYVDVNGSGFCKLASVEAIAKRMKKRLSAILEVDIEKQPEIRPWVTKKLQQEIYPSSKSLLAGRIELAKQRYDELIELARNGRCVNAPETSLEHAISSP